MLNDTIVDIYLSYLLDTLEENKKQHVHLFSTFFYCKFRSALIKGKNFDEEVKRWEKDVKLFEKDYLVIPICVFHHWILVIVCLHTNPRRVYPYTSVRDQYASGCILLFDSLHVTSSSRPLTRPIRKFLTSRWKFERPGSDSPEFGISDKFAELYAIVPKQRNTSDCGVYLLNSFRHFFSRPRQNLKKIKDGLSLVFEWSFDPKKFREEISRDIREAKT